MNWHYLNWLVSQREERIYELEQVTIILVKFREKSIWKTEVLKGKLKVL